MPRMPLAAIDKLIRESSQLRVSKAAKEKLREILEDKATQIGKDAASMAEHSKRTTILEQDVEFVATRKK